MSTSIGQSIDALCKEHGIERDLVIEAMKEAVRAAARKQFKSGEEIAVEWSSEAGIELFASKVIVEEVLPRGQQPRGEQWNQGERIRVVIEDVLKESKGPQIVVSRSSPEMLKRLFEMEVPEIYDETVVIKSAVREPGERAKIAVA